MRAAYLRIGIRGASTEHILSNVRGGPFGKEGEPAVEETIDRGRPRKKRIEKT